MNYGNNAGYRLKICDVNYEKTAWFLKCKKLQIAFYKDVG